MIDLRPKDVARFLGVPGSALPRQVYNTIGEAMVPPCSRGKSSVFSEEDACLIRLGRDLRDFMPPHKVREALSLVRDWLVLDVRPLVFLVVGAATKPQLVPPHEIESFLGGKDVPVVVLWLQGAMESAQNKLRRLYPD